MKRIPELDGLRGVAIALVLYRHYVDNLVAPSNQVGRFLLIPGRLSWSGVDLFFVLSGFLIGGILLDTRESPRYFSAFYLRRACRILPLYAVMCVLAVAIGAVWPSIKNTPIYWLVDSPMPWWSYVTYTQNFWMAHRGIFGATGIGMSWSLAIEEQFYFTLPLVIRFVRIERLKYWLAVAVVAIPFLRILLFFGSPRGFLADYVLMPCRADALLLGVLCAILVRNDVAWAFLQAQKPKLWRAFVILLAGAALLSVRYLGPYTLRMISIGYTWLALLYACTLLLAISGTIVGRALRNSVLRWLGSIAYGLYLVHIWTLGFCLGILRGHGLYVRSVADAGCVTLALILTLGICHASWRYFEKPIVEWGHHQT